MAEKRIARWVYDGFHGRANISVQVPADAKVNSRVEISARVARRLSKLVCGMTNCQCGEFVVEVEYLMAGWPRRYYVTLPEAPASRWHTPVVRGNYPSAG